MKQRWLVIFLSFSLLFFAACAPKTDGDAMMDDGTMMEETMEEETMDGEEMEEESEEGESSDG